MTRKMKDSGVEWIGDIPQHWETIKYKYVLNKRKEILKEYTDEDVLSLTLRGVIKRNLENPTGKMPASFDGYQKVYKNNLLLCLFDIDVTPRCVGVINEDGITSPAYSQYEIEDNNHLKFIYYQLLAIDNDKVLVNFTKSLRNTLTDLDFGALMTVRPDYDEQVKIANFLDEKTYKIDKIIEKTKQSIEELKAYKQSLITETVTKGLNPDVPMKDSEIEWIGKIPSNWETGKLKNFTTVNDDSLSNNTPDDYKFKYIDIGSVSLENGIEKYEITNFKEAPSRARRIVKDKDIIISTVRTYLKAIAVINDEWEDTIVSTGFAVIRPREINSTYLSYFLKSDIFTERVNQLSEGIAYPSISSEKLINIPILIPDYEAQIEIGNLLNKRTKQIDHLISKKQQIINELTSYKQSLIYEYVTGKKEVK